MDKEVPLYSWPLVLQVCQDISLWF